MKHRIAAASAAMAIGAMSALAYDVKVDGIYYNIIDGEYLEVTSVVKYPDMSFEPDCEAPLKRISGYAHNDYAGEIVIPDSVAVEGFDGLLPVAAVGKYAFFNSLKLDAVTLPATIQKFGDYAFAASSIKKLDLGELNDQDLGEGLCYMCNELTEVVFPQNLSEISPRAFMRTGLRELTIPKTVDFLCVKSFAFSDLEKIDGLDSVRNFSYDCFDGTCLKEVTIHECTNNLQWNAFANLANLEKVISLKTDPEDLAPYSMYPMDCVFYGSNPDCTLWVPDESLELYKASERWTSFFKDIRPLSQVGLKPAVAADGGEVPALFDLSGRRVTDPTPGRIYIGTDGSKIRY